MRAIHTCSEECVGLVEEEYGCDRLLFHQFTVLAEERFHILFGVADPFALDSRHIHQHNVASCGLSQLIHRFGLASARAAVEQAGESLSEAPCLQSLVYLTVLLVGEEAEEFVHLFLDLIVEEQLLLLQFIVFEESRNAFFGDL